MLLNPQYHRWKRKFPRLWPFPQLAQDLHLENAEIQGSSWGRAESMGQGQGRENVTARAELIGCIFSVHSFIGLFLAFVRPLLCRGIY